MTPSTKEQQYRLKVTAGGDYDRATQKPVLVNGESLRIDSDRATIDLTVRIQDYNGTFQIFPLEIIAATNHIYIYQGYPENSPTTSDYFKDDLHVKDKYSISFSFTPKEDIDGNDLVFGNDFDLPVRDKLPMGFNAALRLVKWTIDPSIDADAYADKPYLFSPALVTWNQWRIGDKNSEAGQRHPKDYIVREGADGEGEKIRQELQIPDTADARRRHFHNEDHRLGFTFEAGRSYMADFGNQYISFSGAYNLTPLLAVGERMDCVLTTWLSLDMSVQLPGIHIPVLDLVDDEHRELRYVLKDVKTGRVYLVVLLTLISDSDSAPPSKEEDVD